MSTVDPTAPVDPTAVSTVDPTAGAVRAADVLLSDGATVHIRQIEPGDADSIVAMHGRFSERTRYLRYFSPYPRIPERDLVRFVNVDHHDREALVVQAGDQLVAVGRFDRLGPGSDEAEVAFVVQDDYQGRGIGSILLEHLGEAGRQEGLRRFVAEVLPVNSAMLHVFADAGFEVARQYADGVVHLHFPIAITDASLAVQYRREQLTEARSIARLLTPRGVALYGASRAGRGIGAALRAHLADFAGPVLVVRPDATGADAGQPDGPDGPVRVVGSLRAAPVPVDLAVVAVPAAAVPAALADAAAAGVAGLVVVSAGFAEAGPAGAARQDDLLHAARAAGMRLVGPNCLGIANTDPAVRLNATVARDLPVRGRVGFFCQSGAFGAALLAEAARRGLGLSTFVSAGNRADVSGNDLLQYWQTDPATDVVLLYLETFGNPRKFARIARRLGRDKPIVAVAATARPVPQPGQSSGDSWPAGPDAAGVATLFAHTGVIRVDTVAELFDVGLLLAHQPLPAGARIAVVTNSSALGRLAASAGQAAGLTVAPGYPMDVGPLAGPVPFAAALAAAARDDGVDALVVVLSPPFLLDAPAGGTDTDQSTVDSAGTDGFGAAVARVAGGDKPVVASYLGGTLPAGVPGYPSVEEAVRALGRVARYAQWRRTPAGRLPVLSDVDTAMADEVVSRAAPVAHLLACYGITVVGSRRATGADAAVAAADEIGYPVVVKAADPGLRHRIDLGAVRLDLAGPDDVRRACAELASRFGGDAGTPPELIVQGQVPPGVSCTIDMVEDPGFGPVVGFGPGGVAGELLGDQAWRPAPLSDEDAAALVREPRTSPLLSGHRGAAPVDTGALADLLLRVGLIADRHPQIRRLSLNPVLARPDGVSVLHASIEYGEPARPDSGPRRLR